VHEWLVKASERLAAEGCGEAFDYVLSQQDIDDLLELARIASHESGERINAPLVCYLVGLARARYGRELSDLVDAVVARAV
jgi:phosphopantothenate synthetase